MTATIKKLDLLILIALIMAALLLSVFIAGCAAPQPETLVDTDTLQVIIEGPETTVFDKAGAQQYKFNTGRIKATQARKVYQIGAKKGGVMSG